jgi:sarcosine oxidase subunit beta
MRVAHGAPCFTPDKRGLVGGVGGVDGLYVMGGCNEGGISHGPGWGRLIAELVVAGVPTNPVADAFAPGRFAGEFESGRDVLEALDGGWGARGPGDSTGAEHGQVAVTAGAEG